MYIGASAAEMDYLLSFTDMISNLELEYSIVTRETYMSVQVDITKRVVLIPMSIMVSRTLMSTIEPEKYSYPIHSCRMQSL
jgi:hypothetical protein